MHVFREAVLAAQAMADGEHAFEGVAVAALDGDGGERAHEDIALRVAAADRRQIAGKTVEGHGGGGAEADEHGRKSRPISAITSA